MLSALCTYASLYNLFIPESHISKFCFSYKIYNGKLEAAGIRQKEQKTYLKYGVLTFLAG